MGSNESVQSKTIYIVFGAIHSESVLHKNLLTRENLLGGA